MQSSLVLISAVALISTCGIAQISITTFSSGGPVQGSSSPTVQVRSETSFGEVFGGAGTFPLGSNSVTGGLTFALPPKCLADIADDNGQPGSDGLVTAGDFIAFNAAYFGGNLLVADIAGPNQSRLADGALNADDFVVFNALYFAGCN